MKLTKIKLTKPLILLSTLLAFSPMAQATEQGETLFTAKCSACHSTIRPTNMNKVIAPALMGVMRHLKDSYPNKTEAVAFIKDYALNPSKEKAICMPQKLERFGLMPSQKGNVTAEELEVIASWMFDNFPPKGFRGMGQGNRKNMHKPLRMNNQANSQLGSLKNSPFLMNQDALPHLTNILIESWDKATLALTDKQKEKLLVVRKETVTNVKKVKQALTVLEAEVIEMSVDGEALKTIQPKVEEVAKLKAQATMIQLKCIKNSLEILNDEQVELLLPFWDL